MHRNMAYIILCNVCDSQYSIDTLTCYVLNYLIISGVRFQYFALQFGFGLVVLKTAVSVLFFVLFCFQLSASATHRTMNGFLSSDYRTPLLIMLQLNKEFS